MADKNDSSLNEKALLGYILSQESGDALLTASTILEENDFTLPQNRLIFKTILDMSKKNIKADYATLVQELDNLHILDTVGGREYIKSLLDSMDEFPSNPENYINYIKDRALLNSFIKKLGDIQKDAEQKPISDISSFIGKAESDIVSITQKRRVSQFLNMSELSDQIVATLVKQSDYFNKHKHRVNGVTGLETGYSNLDHLTKGWHGGNTIIIGARPSVGKTTFSINLLYQVAKRGIPVLFFSLEMGPVSIGMKLLSLISDLTTDEINDLQFLPGSKKEQIQVLAKDNEQVKNVKKLQSGLNELASLPFYIDDDRSSRILDIISKCTKLKNLVPDLGLVAIDYLGRITNGKVNDSRQAEIASYSNQLKQLALDLDIPIIILSQLSRLPDRRKEGHKPQMSDLRDSGDIEQDADMILMLYRSDYYDNNSSENFDSAEMNNNNPISQVFVSLVKNRNGPTGQLKFIYDRSHNSFMAAADDREDAPFNEV